MTKNRLPYETIAGNLSAETTYKQLLEYIVLLEEDLRLMSNMAKGRNDFTNSKRWLMIADNFTKIQSIITVLAKAKANISIGFTGNA